MHVSCALLQVLTPGGEAGEFAATVALKMAKALRDLELGFLIKETTQMSQQADKLKNGNFNPFFFLIKYLRSGVIA